jgi:hypothetical protein
VKVRDPTSVRVALSVRVSTIPHSDTRSLGTSASLEHALSQVRNLFDTW